MMNTSESSDLTEKEKRKGREKVSTVFKIARKYKDLSKEPCAAV